MNRAVIPVNCKIGICVAIIRDGGHPASMTRSFAHFFDVCVIVMGVMSIVHPSTSLRWAELDIV